MIEHYQVDFDKNYFQNMRKNEIIFNLIEWNATTEECNIRSGKHAALTYKILFTTYCKFFHIVSTFLLDHSIDDKAGYIVINHSYCIQTPSRVNDTFGWFSNKKEKHTHFRVVATSVRFHVLIIQISK